MRQIASDDGTFSREANRTPDSMWTKAVKWPRPDPGRPRVPHPGDSNEDALAKAIFVVFVVLGLSPPGYLSESSYSIREGRRALKCLWHIKGN